MYFMQQQEEKDQKLTCVGTVTMKAKVSFQTQTMFDLCSSDNWILSALDTKLGAKKVSMFEVIV